MKLYSICGGWCWLASSWLVIQSDNESPVQLKVLNHHRWSELSEGFFLFRGLLHCSVALILTDGGHCHTGSYLVSPPKSSVFKPNGLQMGLHHPLNKRRIAVWWKQQRKWEKMRKKIGRSQREIRNERRTGGRGRIGKWRHMQKLRWRINREKWKKGERGMQWKW